MTFIAGAGQQGDDFLAQGSGYRLALSPTTATFQLTNLSKRSKDAQGKGILTQSAALTMQLVGSDPAAHAAQNAVPTGHANYFLGKDRSKWRTEVPLYSSVRYSQVYKGVDLVYYGNQNQLEYDFLVHPGIDPKQIALKFKGAKSVRIAANGDLLLGLGQGEVRWHKPLTYQNVAGKKRMVASSFVLKKGGKVGFEIARYDTSRALTIDPQLLYSTLIGGSTLTSIAGVAVDSAGEIYVTGETQAADFPVTADAFQKTFASKNLNPLSAFVMKLSATGVVRYATYLGGSNIDDPFAIAVDSQGCAYVTGNASSTDFPVTPGAFQTANLGTIPETSYGSVGNAFVTKLNATGSALVYSTYLGGHSDASGGDIGYGIAVDNFGNAYITGAANSLDFPTTSGAFQRTVIGKGNGFITKLNPAGSALTYSTYLGGSAPTECRAIAVDGGNGVYVTGKTNATDFPTTPGAFETTATPIAGGTYGFVTKMNAAGTAQAYSTYLNGYPTALTYSAGYGIAVDSVGSAYVTGATYATPALITPGAVNWGKPLNHLFPTTDVFVTKLNTTGTGLVYSADLGSGVGYAVAVDRLGNACISGTAGDPDFATTVGAFQRRGNQSTGVLSRLNATGTALLYSTYLAGYLTEGYGVAIDSLGQATIVGGTYPQAFPTTPNALISSQNAGNHFYGYVARLLTHPIFPDFNGDGATDLLLLNHTTGRLELWLMNGSTVQGTTSFDLTPPAAYTPVGVGDFSCDGSLTLAFQSSVDNRVVFWYTKPGSVHVSGGDYVNQTPAAGWKLMSIADFNQDGRSDLLFQNETTGQIALWYMSGPYYQGGIVLPKMSGAGWKVVGTGDFNADGFGEIIFQNQTNGAIKLWRMQGPTFVSEAMMSPTPAAGWKVVSVGDFNGDGMADLLFQNQTTNQCAVWYMNAAAYMGGSNLSQYPPSDRKVVGPR